MAQINILNENKSHSKEQMVICFYIKEEVCIAFIFRDIIGIFKILNSDSVRKRSQNSATSSRASFRVAAFLYIKGQVCGIVSEYIWWVDDCSHAQKGNR